MLVISKMNVIYELEGYVLALEKLKKTFSLPREIKYEVSESINIIVFASEIKIVE